MRIAGVKRRCQQDGLPGVHPLLYDIQPTWGAGCPHIRKRRLTLTSLFNTRSNSGTSYPPPTVSFRHHYILRRKELKVRFVSMLFTVLLFRCSVEHELINLTRCQLHSDGSTAFCAKHTHEIVETSTLTKPVQVHLLRRAATCTKNCTKSVRKKYRRKKTGRVRYIHVNTETTYWDLQ